MPLTSWGKCRAYGTWYNHDGSLKPGAWVLTIPRRLVTDTDDGIIPRDTVAVGTLSTAPGAPSFDQMVPSNTDPDIFPNDGSWKVELTVTFNDGSEAERFTFDTPEGGEVNLKDVVMLQSFPSQAASLIRGIPGGVAALDGSGLVLDGNGDPVVSGGAVDSVNGQTGVVTLTAADVGAASTSALAAKADLVGGVIPSAQIPAIAITDTYTVATQAAMLALSAQRGDVAIRTDISKAYILSTDSPATLADWKEIVAPGQVVSVAGKTGVVTLTPSDAGVVAATTAVSGIVELATTAEATTGTDTTRVVTPAGLAAAIGASGTVTNARPMHVIVASADAPAFVKDYADYICDGTADQTEIIAAVDLAAPLQSRNATMPAGAGQRGKVELSGGRFNLSAPVPMRSGVHITGVGWLTELRAVSLVGGGLLTLASAQEHAVQVSHIFFNGNYASGGAGAAIDFDMSASTGTSGYPSTSPDAYHHLHDLFLDGFKGSTRHGIRLRASSGSNNRGNIIDRCQVRNITGHGISLESASDSFISNCHVGTITGNGYNIASGNTKLANCKSFYCDTNGFYASSGRGTVAGFESQDDAVGMYFDAEPWATSALTIDTASTYGLRVGTSGLVVAGLSVFNRSGGRYATTGTGLYFDAAGHTDLSITGVVDAVARITTAWNATAPGARSFVRVSDGVGAMLTAG